LAWPRLGFFAFVSAIFAAFAAAACATGELAATLARINPISYVIVGIRSLVIDGWDAGKIGAAVLVIVLLGIILTGLSLRAIATYDR